MKKIGDLLNSQKLEQKLSKADNQKEVLESSWQICMGDACFSHTNRMVLKNGILTVYMDSQVWQQELMMSDPKKLAESMAERTGRTIVDVKIKTGG